MSFFAQYQNGVNLGGWLSQFSLARQEHFQSFVQEKDIQQIAQWGADHVRLPVDCDVLENPQQPFDLNQAGIAYVDRCLKWCEKYHLNVILDLHHAEGHVYGEMEKIVPLFTDPVLRTRFLKIWKTLAARYRGIGKQLTFELLNEISDASGYLWNNLCADAIQTIRGIDSSRTILVGSNEANSVFTLNQLHLFDDPNVVYNFHFYDPMTFTHQKAHFSQDLRDFNTTVHYPGKIAGFPAYLAAHRQYVDKFYRTVWDDENDRPLMQRYLANAANFVRYTGRELYCGEFGAIIGAPEKDAAAWVTDVRNTLDSLKIGHAYWSYKEMDFGLVNTGSEVVRPLILQALFQNS
ncbi:MAG: glycoside hydrolase family 5 protein [Oscillospiraceae bacterium]|jgi:aryl-phospho-beta-D-glucosidase BglC (GH1 family)|nr:glycoside hydrolase family 5 protein [Oscillospiraceae bacterium]